MLSFGVKKSRPQLIHDQILSCKSRQVFTEDFTQEPKCDHCDLRYYANFNFWKTRNMFQSVLGQLPPRKIAPQPQN